MCAEFDSPLRCSIPSLVEGGETFRDRAVFANSPHAFPLEKESNRPAESTLQVSNWSNQLPSVVQPYSSRESCLVYLGNSKNVISL